MVRWEGFEPPTLWFVALSTVEDSCGLQRFHYQKNCLFDQCYTPSLRGFFGKDLELKMSEELKDELYDLALVEAMRLPQFGTATLQRHFSIGYNRASWIIEAMEKNGRAKKVWTENSLHWVACHE